MERNKKTLGLIALAGLASLTVLGLAISQNGNLGFGLFAEGAGTSKTLSFNMDNKPSLTSGVGTSQSRYVSVECGGASVSSDGFIHLAAGSGYVRNVGMINELESVTAVFTGDAGAKLRLGYSYYDALENDNLDIWSRETGDGGAVYLTSGVTTTVDLSACRYLYFAAETADVDITSIAVKYGANGCVKPSVKALPENLNKVFNATNRLNIDLPSGDFTTAKADYDADGTAESDYVIHLDQGKPTANYGYNTKTAHDDANVFNDWLAANGVGDITALSRESTATSYMNNVADAGGYTGKSYRRTVNFVVNGAEDGSTILPEFIVNPYISYDWGADAASQTKVGDYNLMVGGEFHVGDPNPDIADQMFIMQYDVNLSFKNVTFKGVKGLEFLYGWTGTANSPESRTVATSENQIENDLGTDLGTVQSLNVKNCKFEISSAASAATQGIDLKAFVGTKTNAFTSTTVDIRRHDNVTIDGCNFLKIHDASKQSSAVYGNGFNNVKITNCTFGSASYDGSSDTNAVDYNCFQCSNYTLAGANVFSGNAVYACNSRALRFNAPAYATGASLAITNNAFAKGCAVSQTANEGYGKFNANDLAQAKAGIDNFRFGNDNAFQDNSGNDISSTVIANRTSAMYLINAYVNYDVANNAHIAY